MKRNYTLIIICISLMLIVGGLVCMATNHDVWAVVLLIASVVFAIIGHRLFDMITKCVIALIIITAPSSYAQKVTLMYDQQSVTTLLVQCNDNPFVKWSTSVMTTDLPFGIILGNQVQYSPGDTLPVIAIVKASEGIFLPKGTNPFDVKNLTPESLRMADRAPGVYLVLFKLARKEGDFDYAGFLCTNTLENTAFKPASYYYVNISENSFEFYRAQENPRLYHNLAYVWHYDCSVLQEMLGEGFVATNYGLSITRSASQPEPKVRYSTATISCVLPTIKN